MRKANRFTTKMVNDNRKYRKLKESIDTEISNILTESGLFKTAKNYLKGAKKFANNYLGNYAAYANQITDNKIAYDKIFKEFSDIIELANRGLIDKEAVEALRPSMTEYLSHLKTTFDNETGKFKKDRDYRQPDNYQYNNGETKTSSNQTSNYNPYQRTAQYGAYNPYQNSNATRTNQTYKKSFQWPKSYDDLKQMVNDGTLRHNVGDSNMYYYEGKPIPFNEFKKHFSTNESLNKRIDRIVESTLNSYLQHII